MEKFNLFVGMIRLSIPLNLLIIIILIIAITSSSVLASICQEKQYLNAEQQTCLNCTECRDGSVVLRPCEQHRDTYCGPISALSDLLISSGSSGGSSSSSSSNNNNNNNNNHHHNRHHHTIKKHHNRHEKHRKDEDDRLRHENTIKSNNNIPSTAALESTADHFQQPPFTNAETLIWDWQAIALTSAVFACILFFLVVTLYSLHQARQWRQLKENFDADVEELSARLSLMAATSTEKCELFDTVDHQHRGFPMPTTHHQSTADHPTNILLQNRCVYLEKLLSVRKETEKSNNKNSKGNVYIEENKPKK